MLAESQSTCTFLVGAFPPSVVGHDGLYGGAEIGVTSTTFACAKRSGVCGGICFPEPDTGAAVDAAGVAGGELVSGVGVCALGSPGATGAGERFPVAESWVADEV